MSELTYPLPRELNRCLGHWEGKGESCPRVDLCARHITLRHDPVPVPAQYRCCTTESFTGFLRVPGGEA